MRIDVHAHFFQETYLDLLERFGTGATDVARNRGAGGSDAELEARLELMDSAQIQMQVLSVSPQLPYFEDETHAVEAARAINDLYADLVRRYPTRFAAFAAAPLPQIDAALALSPRALDQLHMVGVTVATSIIGRSLADPEFEPLYAELDQRGAVLYIHPAGESACSPLIANYGLTWPIGAPSRTLSPPRNSSSRTSRCATHASRSSTRTWEVLCRCSCNGWIINTAGRPRR